LASGASQDDTENLASTVIRPWTVQIAASHHTIYAILAAL